MPIPSASVAPISGYQVGIIENQSVGVWQPSPIMADVTLTQINLNASVIELVGSPVAGHNIIWLTTNGTQGSLKGMRYLVNNLTGQTQTLKYQGATGFALTAGSTCTCYFSGTDMVKI